MGSPHIRRFPRLRVAVLYGGISSEREVSLASGAAVAEALTAAGHAVTCLDPAETSLEQFDFRQIDAAFIALHGEFGEDGQVQQWLETAGVPYTGSDVQASRLAISKSASKERFAQHGVPTPRYVLIHESDPAGRILAQARTLGFPLVVKPDSQGSSVGVSVLAEAGGLPAALALSFQHDAFALLETYIAGTEWTAGFLDQTPFPLIRIGTDRGFFDYQAKYRDDATRYEFDAAVSAEAMARLQAAAAAACRALGTRGLARVDLMLDREERPWVLEVNTVPGLTSHSLVPKAAARLGIDFVTLCERSLRSAFEAAGGRGSERLAACRST